MNEKMAAERYGGEVRVGKYPSGRNHRALAMHNPMGFVKLVVPPEGDDRVRSAAIRIPLPGLSP